jgi:hypothetical protein
MKYKITELTTHSKNMRAVKRGINEFTKGYQPEFIKDESIWNMSKNYFFHLQYVHKVSEAIQLEIQLSN